MVDSSIGDGGIGPLCAETTTQKKTGLNRKKCAKIPRSNISGMSGMSGMCGMSGISGMCGMSGISGMCGM